MPVVVTPADTPVGRALVPLLRDSGSEVRATIADIDAADPLRALGAKVAVVEQPDDDTLRAIVDEAHTVCLLSNDLFVPGEESYEEAIEEWTQAVLRAARKARVRRVLLVSYPGASSSSSNHFLRSAGLAEEAVRDSSPEHAILRCSHIYGIGSPWLDFVVRASTQEPPVVVGSGKQRLAPVYAGDVARALAEADDRELPMSGTYGLQGPDVVTADELADLLGGSGRPKRHVRAEAGSPEIGLGARPHRLSWSPAIGEVLAADSLAGEPAADQEFGLELTPLAAGLAASGVESAPGTTVDLGQAHPGENRPARDTAI